MEPDKNPGRYHHACPNCEYLGEYNEYDLFYCRQGKEHDPRKPMVVARYGVALEDQACMSKTIDSKHQAAIDKAVRLAKGRPLPQ